MSVFKPILATEAIRFIYSADQQNNLARRMVSALDRQLDKLKDVDRHVIYEALLSRLHQPQFFFVVGDCEKLAVDGEVVHRILYNANLMEMVQDRDELGRFCRSWDEVDASLNDLMQDVVKTILANAKQILEASKQSRKTMDEQFKQLQKKRAEEEQEYLAADPLWQLEQRVAALESQLAAKA